MSKEYKRGYDWAKEELARGVAKESIEAQCEGAFDFNDLDRGALAAVREIE